MLLQFRFKNHRSFAEDTIIDFTATNIREHWNTLIVENEVKVLPVTAVFGANASGKSNLFRAMKAMIKIVRGAGLSLTVPFAFDEIYAGSPAEYEMCFSACDVEYRYGFECTKEKVYSEWLFQKPFRKGTRAKSKLVFYRERGSFEVGSLAKETVKELQYAREMAAENQLILNVFGKRKKVKQSEVYDFFEGALITLEMADPIHEIAINRMCAEEFYNHEEQLKFASDLIHLIDPDILMVKVEKSLDASLNEKYTCYAVHSGGGTRSLQVPFEMESSGTNKVLSLALWIELCLDRGCILLIDELDVKLHPLILRYIVQLFTNPQTNPHGAQLVFSSHNLICLDATDLRRDEIWFVEKNHQRSELFSLYDFKQDDSSVRSDLSFGKNYLAGRFGAIPFQKEVE